MPREARDVKRKLSCPQAAESFAPVARFVKEVKRHRRHVSYLRPARALYKIRNKCIANNCFALLPDGTIFYANRVNALYIKILRNNGRGHKNTKNDDWLSQMGGAPVN